jgi:hypothetical protein
LFLPLSTKLFLTRVHARFEGDTRFPKFDASEWTLVSAERGSPDAGQPSYTFEVHDRVSSSAP